MELKSCDILMFSPQYCIDFFQLSPNETAILRWTLRKTERYSASMKRRKENYGAGEEDR